jgi:hypothetical protein
VSGIAVATHGQALLTAIGLLSLPAVIVVGVIVALWYRFMERRSAGEAVPPAVSPALRNLEASEASPASTST